MSTVGLELDTRLCRNQRYRPLVPEGPPVEPVSLGGRVGRGYDTSGASTEK